MNLDSIDLDDDIQVDAVSCEDYSDVDGSIGMGQNQFVRFGLCWGCLSGDRCVSSPHCLIDLLDYPLIEGNNDIAWYYDKFTKHLFIGVGDNMIRIIKKGSMMGFMTDFTFGKSVNCSDQGQIYYSDNNILFGSFSVGWRYFLDEFGIVSAALNDSIGLIASIILHSLQDIMFRDREQNTLMFVSPSFYYSPGELVDNLFCDELMVHTDMVGGPLVREDIKRMLDTDHGFEPHSLLSSIGEQVKRKLLKKNIGEQKGSRMAHYGSGYHDIKFMFSLRLEACFYVDNDQTVFPKIIENFNSLLKNSGSRLAFQLIPISADVTLPLVDSKKLNSAIPVGLLDIATSFYSFQHFCFSKQTAMVAVMNIVRSLRRGGKFLMIVPDSKKFATFQNTDQCSIVFPQDTNPQIDYNYFGKRYYVTIKPKYINLREYIVPLDEVISMFESMDCSLLYRSNMDEYYIRGRQVKISTYGQKHALAAAGLYQVVVIARNGPEDKRFLPVKKSVMPLDIDVKKSVTFPDQLFRSEDFISFFPKIASDAMLFQNVFHKNRPAPKKLYQAKTGATKKNDYGQQKKVRKKMPPQNVGRRAK